VPLLGKSKSGFPNPKMDFAFVWANPRRDHESIKSTLLVDSFSPTDFVHLCNYDILTKPMLVVPYFEPEVTHHSVFVIYLHSSTVFKTLLVMFLYHVCIVCFYESVNIFQVIYIKKTSNLSASVLYPYNLLS